MNKKYYYLKDDAALEEWRKTHTGRSYTVNRFKGLGELNVEETEDTLLDENNRILHQVTVEDVNAADKLFEDLMGTAIGPRKAYIKAHSKEATDNVE